MDSNYILALGQDIESMLPDAHGFALFVFPFSSQAQNNLQYVANAQQEGVRKMLLEWAGTNNTLPASSIIRDGGPARSIVIGDYAKSSQHNEFVIKITGYELRTILTDAEFDMLMALIRRMEVKRNE